MSAEICIATLYGIINHLAVLVLLRLYKNQRNGQRQRYQTLENCPVAHKVGNYFAHAAFHGDDVILIDMRLFILYRDSNYQEQYEVRNTSQHEQILKDFLG